MLVRHPDVGIVAAVGRYDGGLAAAIRDWKLAGRRDLTDPLGEALASAVAVLTGSGAVVSAIPVPVRPASRRRRGCDLIAELAAAAQRRVPGLEVVPALRWDRAVSEQVGAPAEARRANLAGAMRAVGPLAGPAVVIDDVLTTGATLTEATRAVRAAGGAPVAAAVLGLSRQPRADARVTASEG